MRKPSKALLAVAAVGGVLGAARRADAQADVNLPLPNVLLLVDSSGSMEYKSSSSELPTCDETNASSNERSRWIELIEVLTGSIQDYRCQAVERNSRPFREEYQLGTLLPYDFGYPKPYHRPLSGTCTPGPGTAPTTNAYLYPDDAIRFHPYNDRLTTCTTFLQSGNGLLDSFLNQIRFGLMTFDSLPHRGTGVVGTSPSPASGIQGTWSYYLGSPAQGRPAGCGYDTDQEVGARNAAAPPWEGRMIAFGPPNAGGTEINRRNEWIQKTLLTTRPYGATPIAGILHDARNFLWNDTTPDPLNSGEDFGPANDAYVGGGCRGTHIILLTDGEPNMDLRDACEGPGGVCPFDTPEEIAWDLAHSSRINRRAKVHVVGFALPTVSVGTEQIDCTELSNSDLLDSDGLCATHDDRALQACCTLNRIAYNGDTARAHFANNSTELRKAIAEILRASVTATSRTLPAFSAGASGFGSAQGFRFFSSFKPTRKGLWTGVLERQRFVCDDSLQPQPEPISSSKGDDFASNLNSGTGSERKFYTYLGTRTGGAIHSSRSLRPRLTEDDGAGIYGGTELNGSASVFVNNMPPDAANLPDSPCVVDGLSGEACRDRYFRWFLGLSNGTEYHRCPSPGENCNLLGSIYHSTPVVVNRPSELIRDETYELYAVEHAKRPLMLYTSTTDGMLHAFKVAPNDPDDDVKVDGPAPENNELWAFIPPAMLPLLSSQYPDSQARLLDAPPVVKEVAATEESGGYYRYERTAEDARQHKATWRTVLVQGMGQDPGYFALDITDPESGPQFLWQLTTDSDGTPLFGSSSATPVITTLFFDDAGAGAREIAVAVLPGGEGPPDPVACRRHASPSGFPDFPPRQKVPCYSDPAALRGRSLTVVRLDNGKIIRTFRQSAEAPLDSPVTGQPVAFPGETGVAADRVYVGDRDGTLWRVDLSSTSPSNWFIELFFDAYFNHRENHDEGQPIDTAPTLSVDPMGNVTLAVATGDQDVLTADDQTNYVYSLTDTLRSTSSDKVAVNWYETLVQGDRVAGPITIFSGVLYFSTYRPVPSSTGDVCDTGSSCVWGLDYLEPETADRPESGGLQALPQEIVDAMPTTDRCLRGSNNPNNPLSEGSIVFGVAVTQLPSCTQDVPNQETDRYYGTNTHKRVAQITPAQFQLLMQTGSAGAQVAGGQTRTVSVNLPPPASSPRIDSWAAILE